VGKSNRSFVYGWTYWWQVQEDIRGLVALMGDQKNIDYVETADSVYGGMSDDPGRLRAA
jgi:putative alpha-1,2-mannosidase